MHTNSLIESSDEKFTPFSGLIQSSSFVRKTSKVNASEHLLFLH